MKNYYRRPVQHTGMSRYRGVPVDSPVEQARKAGPRGDGQWLGFSYVWSKIQEGCIKMAQDPYVHLSDDHVNAMGDLGSGHEERMKARLWWMREHNYI